TQQNGKDLVRVDESTVFGDSANPIGVPVGSEPCVAPLLHYRLLKHGDMWLDWLRVDTGKKRVKLLPDRYKLDSPLAEDVGENTTAGAMHGINRKFELCLRDQVEVGKFANRLDVGTLQVGFGDPSRVPIRHRAGADLVLDDFHDGRSCGSAELRLELHSIPVPGIVAG